MQWLTEEGAEKAGEEGNCRCCGAGSWGLQPLRRSAWPSGSGPAWRTAELPWAALTETQRTTQPALLPWGLSPQDAAARPMVVVVAPPIAAASTEGAGAVATPRCSAGRGGHWRR